MHKDSHGFVDSSTQVMQGSISEAELCQNSELCSNKENKVEYSHNLSIATDTPSELADASAHVDRQV